MNLQWWLLNPWPFSHCYHTQAFNIWIQIECLLLICASSLGKPLVGCTSPTGFHDDSKCWCQSWPGGGREIRWEAQGSQGQGASTTSCPITEGRNHFTQSDWAPLLLAYLCRARWVPCCALCCVKTQQRNMIYVLERTTSGHPIDLDPSAKHIPGMQWRPVWLCFFRAWLLISWWNWSQSSAVALLVHVFSTGGQYRWSLKYLIWNDVKSVRRILWELSIGSTSHWFDLPPRLRWGVGLGGPMGNLSD